MYSLLPNSRGGGVNYFFPKHPFQVTNTPPPPIKHFSLLLQHPNLLTLPLPCMQTINFNQTHHPHIHTSTLVIKPKQLFFKKTEVNKNLGKMQPETKKCVLIKKCIMKILKRIPTPKNWYL